MTGEVRFAAQALMDVEGRFASRLLSCWRRGETSLFGDEVGGLADSA